MTILVMPTDKWPPRVFGFQVNEALRDGGLRGYGTSRCRSEFIMLMMNTEEWNGSYKQRDEFMDQCAEIAGNTGYWPIIPHDWKPPKKQLDGAYA